MTTLNMETDRKADRTVIVLSGELDLSTASSVEAELASAERERPPLMVLDLRELQFMDSTGLRLLLAADGRARRQDRRLVLVQGPENVQRVFRIALLDGRLDFVSDPEERAP